MRILAGIPGVAHGENRSRTPVRDSCARSICSSPQRPPRSQRALGCLGAVPRISLSLDYPDEPRLGENGVDEAYPDLWARYARLAIEEAHRYDGWEALYEQLFGSYVPDPFYDSPRRRTGGGDGGEGPNHKALREWVQDHPECIDKRLRDVDAETEVELLSGDRVDVVYRTPRQIVTIEVKSRDSNWPDLQRGIYQCVKYRAVMEAQEEGSGSPVRSLLVTESALPADLERIVKRLDVGHLRVSPSDR